MKIPPDLMRALLLAFWMIISAAATYLAAKIKRYLDSITKTAEQQAILDRAWKFVQSEVSALSQTSVLALKDAASDGRLTKEDALRMRELATERVRKSLGEAGMRLLDQATGNRSVTEYLEALVEAAVRADKRGDLVAVLGQRASNPPPETQAKP